MFRVPQRCRYFHKVKEAIEHAVLYQAGVLEGMLPNWPLQCALRLFLVLTGVLRVLFYVFKHYDLNQSTYFSMAVEVLSGFKEDIFSFVRVTHKNVAQYVLYPFHVRQDATQQNANTGPLR